MKDFKIQDIIISSIIIAITILYFYVNNVVPSGLKSLNVFGYEVGSFGFQNIWDLIFFSKMKFLVLIFSVIWYLTCKHWWKHSILIIICIELFKIFNIFNPNLLEMDEIEYYSSLPITIPIIFTLILLSIKLNAYNKHTSLVSLIDKEINNELSKHQNFKITKLAELKLKFLKLKKEKTKINNGDYLKKLKLIRDQFYDQL